MTNEDFDDLVMKALAQASASLQAADIRTVWLDTSGSGWTQEYSVIIRTKKPHRRQVIPLDPQKYAQGVREPLAGAAPVWVDDLPPEAKQAVSEALSGVDLGEQVMWAFRAAGRTSAGHLVWPISQRVKDLQNEKAGIEEEIARLQTLDNSKEFYTTPDC